ncbi:MULTISPECIES: cation-translocating P-type ATPase [Nitrospirillum]|uniref:Cu2+-exporting ATPase n=1 Tax=Nitrospirillum amazonense TaxID=28077 RepID=A0A560FTL3_9PROT|nr:cation-translocating P-type ATPase [Nitrospirillum amazonense]MEC4590146.1 cation-translocating P-type ATPase [Nitrospirillum amazonense]TWB24975.1 Cu2+-exporting ATPase [Nitrospirillum amazonense]
MAVLTLPGTHDAPVKAEEIRLASRSVGPKLLQTELSVPEIHCGGCVQRIERAVGRLPGVAAARVNLSTKRLTVRWRDEGTPPPLMETLTRLGFSAHLNDADAGGASARDPVLAAHVRALAVAGFAAGNIMLFSVSIWSGAEPATRDLFHGISAVIALLALCYSGRVFFRSAWRALRRGQTNMDVPISLGVLLAYGMSLYDTLHHGDQAYFDAATSLLFFLLVGRTLDHMMREKARTAVKGLARLAPRGATVVLDDGTRCYLPVADIRPGMTVLLPAGERVPVDGKVIAGRSDIDRALVTGESAPQGAEPGTTVQAGTLNLTGPLTLRATAAAADSFLAEMVRLMEVAESGRGTYRRVADRAARLYAPVVHLTALLTFIGWMATAGDIHRAITIAVAVLIITCPCALGLAVPMVQVVAARHLFDRGILVKDGSALERLAEIDTVVFDKTGTLTLGSPRLGTGDVDPPVLALAAALGAHSSHPRSRALAAAGTGLPLPTLDQVAELPGLGMEAMVGTHVYRLGRPGWAAAERDDGDDVVLSRDGRRLAGFRFQDDVRPDAGAAMARLRAQGLAVEVLSGDQVLAVADLAGRLDITDYKAAVPPGEKAARLADIARAGRKALMVGDGLNDAPALMAAHVSMAPANAVEVGRNAADFVFLRDSLGAVPLAVTVCRRAGRLVRQNFALAILYNAAAVPVAVLGHVSPLIAALAMSLSSIIVVANALRLDWGLPKPANPAMGAGA